MTEEFDALLRFNPQNSVLVVLGILFLAIILEWGLRTAQRWAEHHERHRSAVVLRAFCWQPIFWGVLVIVGQWLTRFSDISVERQQGVNILWSLLLISITIILVRILTGWVKLLAAKQPSASVSVLRYLMNGVAILIVLSVILYALNVPAPLLLLTLLGGTVGISLALRDSIANLFAGVVLTVSQRLSPGDFIRLPSGQEGRVTDIEWDVTTIHQYEDSELIVPNSHMTKAETINFDHPSSEFRLLVDVGVSYDSDLAQVEAITSEIADGVLAEFEAAVSDNPSFIRYIEFGDSAIKFAVHLHLNDFAKRFEVRHEFIKRLHHRYQVEGIEIPFPRVVFYDRTEAEADTPDNSDPGA